MTYKEAIDAWLNVLAANGWEIHRYNELRGGRLKIPYAKYGRNITVWFHPQSMYEGSTREAARSLHMDMKDVNYAKLAEFLKLPTDICHYD